MVAKPIYTNPSKNNVEFCKALYPKQKIKSIPNFDHKKGHKYVA